MRSESVHSWIESYWVRVTGVHIRKGEDRRRHTRRHCVTANTGRDRVAHLQAEEHQVPPPGTRSWEGGRGQSLQSLQKEPAQLTHGFPTSDSQNPERINFHCFKSTGLWSFVVPALEKEHGLHRGNPGGPSGPKFRVNPCRLPRGPLGHLGSTLDTCLVFSHSQSASALTALWNREGQGHTSHFTDRRTKTHGAGPWFCLCNVHVNK